MSSKAFFTALAAVLALGGCGNYSNEDLEFMNALPGGEVGVSVPLRMAGVPIAEQAELARRTHEVTTSLNALLHAITNLVDTIRSFPPSSRTRDSRTWGPYLADGHPGWQSRMIIRRSPIDPAQFEYDISFHPIGGGDTAWYALLTGGFRADQTVRRGRGHFEITTATLRALGFDPKMEFLDHMEVEYDTGAADGGIAIAMDITNLPNPLRADAITHAAYDYAAAADGRRQMVFDFTEDLVPALFPVVETATMTSRWLETGEGRASVIIDEGDGAGLTAAQCWDRRFAVTFNHADWDLLGDVGSAAACVEIAEIAPL